MSSDRFLGGFLLGGLAGLVAGLLFAPRSGRQTRQLIKEELYTQLDQARNGIEDRAHEITGTVKAKADELRHRAHEIADDLERAGIEALDKVRHLKSEVKTPEESPN